MSRIIILLLFFCAFISFTSSFAESSSEDEETLNSFFDLELFSLSKHVESSFDAPAAVFIVTAEDIRRSGALNVAEALRMVPGIQVAQQSSHKWAIGSRGFNFQFTNKLLVLIDGRTVYTPLFAGTLWDIQDLALDDIEKIEVIRGPGATIWGSNAVNGVINIITKNAASTQENYVSATISDRQDRIVEGRLAGKTDDNIFYRTYIKHVDRASAETLTRTNALDSWENIQGGFRVDWNDIGQDSFSLHGDVRRSDAKNYFAFVPTLTAPFVMPSRNDKDSVGVNLVGKWDRTFSNHSKTTTQFYFDYDYVDTNIIARDSYTFDIDFQHVLDFSPQNQLIWGLGYRYIVDLGSPDGTILNYRTFHRYDSLYSAFLQDKIGLIPEELYLTVGSKIEYNGYSGFEYQPSAKLVYYPSDDQTLWGSITRAVRTPSRGEHDGVVRLIGTPAGFVAQTFGPDFDSEILVAYEIGHRIKPTDKLLIETTAFYNDYKQLRSLETTFPLPFPDIFLPLSGHNNAFGEVYGVEINSKYQINEKWKIHAAYSFLTADIHIKPGSTDPVSQLIEGQAPKNQVVLRSYYNITPEIEFDSSFYYVDSLPQSGPTGIDPYIRVDARLGWNPGENFEVSLIGKNLFDEDHPEFQSALFAPAVEISRAFYIKVSSEF